MPSNVGLANHLYTSLVHGCGRAILNLEGGVNRGLDIDLRRDDVYDETEEVPKVTLDLLEDLVRRNSFGVKKPFRMDAHMEMQYTMSRLSSTTAACPTQSIVISAT